MGSTPLERDRPRTDAAQPGALRPPYPQGTRAREYLHRLSVPLLPFPGGASSLLARAETETFLFAETRHDPDTRLSAHAHENATVTVLLDGHSEERAPGTPRHFHLGRGCVLFRPPGAAHVDRFGPEGCANLEIEVVPAGLDALRRHTDVFDSHAYQTAPELMRTVRRIRAELARPAPGRALALEGLALELLATASRGGPSGDRAGGGGSAPPRWLVRVRDLLHERLADDVRLGDLAREAGVSPTHLARAFRRAYGARPAEYLRRVRVDAAASAIERGEGSLAEIAAATGFADQSHLGRAFREAHGVSPARWRSVLAPRRA